MFATAAKGKSVTAAASLKKRATEATTMGLRLKGVCLLVKLLFLKLLWLESLLIW